MMITRTRLQKKLSIKFFFYYVERTTTSHDQYWGINPNHLYFFPFCGFLRRKLIFSYPKSLHVYIFLIQNENNRIPKFFIP